MSYHLVRTFARARPQCRVVVCHRRTLFSLFGSSTKKPEKQKILSEDNLFHPFSASPFPAVQARGKVVQELAPCPVCASSHDHAHAHTKAQPKAIHFECPDCGWPTHCTEEHWKADEEHKKYCSRLREVNEDDHDLRSGRKIHEFDLPGKHARLFPSNSV